MSDITRISCTRCGKDWELAQACECDSKPSELNGACCSAINPDKQYLWDSETKTRTVAIEDEWQTVQDMVESNDATNACYFLDRLIREAEKLKIHMKAKPSL